MPSGLPFNRCSLRRRCASSAMRSAAAASGKIAKNNRSVGFGAASNPLSENCSGMLREWRSVGQQLPRNPRRPAASNSGRTNMSSRPQIAVGLSPDRTVENAHHVHLIVIAKRMGRYPSSVPRVSQPSSAGLPRSGRSGHTAWVRSLSHGESAARIDGSPALRGPQERTPVHIHGRRARWLPALVTLLADAGAGRLAHK